MDIKKYLLDSLDIELLNRMQENNLATAEVLAKTIVLSPSAIARRLRRLRDYGCIASDIAILSPRLIRHRLYAIINIELDSHAPEKGLSALKKRLMAMTEVQFCMEISGSFDITLMVCTYGMEDFNRFVDRELAGSGVVRRYESHFIKKQIKNSPKIKLCPMDIISANTTVSYSGN